jgi:hypothetical protein
MLNNDWLSKQIGADAINKFLDEYNKNDKNLILIKDGRNTYEIEDTSDEDKVVEDGKNISSNTDSDIRKFVRDNSNTYHYEDSLGNKIGESYYYDTPSNYEYGFKDGFAVVNKQYMGDMMLIDKDGKVIPQEEGDKVLYDGNIGYGYYLAGNRYKLRGLKLKDANTGVTLDTYQDAGDVKNSPGVMKHIKGLLASHSSKQVPNVDTYWQKGRKDVEKQNGILFFGNYWFLGPSNIKVTKENDGYHSKSQFGEFVTKLPPIKAIDDNYILCAHNNSIYVYDKKANTYGKSCSRDEVEEVLRKRSAKIGYQRISNSMRALTNYKKTNPESDATIVLTKESALCLPVHIGENGEAYYNIQPVLLEFPQIATCITYNDKDYYVMYNGQRVGISDALRDLRNKASGKNLEEMFNEEELSSGRGK